MHVCDVRFCSTAAVIKAKNRHRLERILFFARLRTIEILPTSCQYDTDALFHEEHVLQCVKNRVCNLNFTSPATCLPGSFVWPARSRFCLRVRTLALCRTQEESTLHLKLCLRDVTDGMRSRKLPVDGGEGNCERIQPVIWLGLPPSAIEDVGHERCGWRFERGSPVRNARVIFRCLIATSTLTGSFFVCNTFTFTSRRKSGRLFIDLSLMNVASTSSQRSRCAK